MQYYIAGRAQGIWIKFTMMTGYARQKVGVHKCIVFK